MDVEPGICDEDVMWWGRTENRRCLESWGLRLSEWPGSDFPLVLSEPVDVDAGGEMVMRGSRVYHPKIWLLEY